MNGVEINQKRNEYTRFLPHERKASETTSKPHSQSIDCWRKKKKRHKEFNLMNSRHHQYVTLDKQWKWNFERREKKPIWMVMIEKIIERHEKTIHGIWHGPQHTRRWHCTQCVLIPNETRNMYFFFSFENQMVFIQNIYLVDGTSNSNQAAIKLLRHATRNEFTQFFVIAFCLFFALLLSHASQIDRTPQINS